MSFTNHTPNYNLPQYVGTDKPTFLGDFNNAMTAIDTALHNNAQNAGEGLSALQKAQAALSETQETLTEVQTEVANVSGIAATVNQNVQQALTAANDATTAANSATFQIQPAVTAANQASADAQAAQQVANGNVTTLNQLSERVTALEENQITEISGIWHCDGLKANKVTGTNTEVWTQINAPEGFNVDKITINASVSNMQLGTNTFQILANSSTGTTIAEYTDTSPVPTGSNIENSAPANTTAVVFKMTEAPQAEGELTFTYTVAFKKASA